MSPIALEVLIIFGLLLANGLFAMAEIAIVSSRRSKLRTLAEAGDAKAQAALALAESPTRFLSTVQLGITLIGVLAGAFGGATLAQEIGQWLQGVPLLADHSRTIGVGVVVLAITFCSVLVGELVPKRIGLNNPEGIARHVARPMTWLARVGNPAVRLLSAATNGLLGLIGIRGENRPAVSEEEVRGILREGAEAGVFLQTETQMVERVLALDRLTVRELMTPRRQIIALGRHEPHAEVWHKIVVSRHACFPVYDGTRDNIVGVVSVKAIYANLAAGVGPVNLADVMEKPLFVPATQTAIQLLATFKETGSHLALVADEFGGFFGLVTLSDVMQAILGDLAALDERNRPGARRREDGTWLVDGMLEIERVATMLPGFRLEPEAGHDYQTLAGYVVKQLGQVPKEGDAFTAQGYRFEVLDMDRMRVDKVFVSRTAAQSDSVQQGASI
jgi:putative hemolysin